MDHEPREQHVNFATQEPLSPQGEATLDASRKKKGFLSGLLRRASLAGGKRPVLKKVGASALADEHE